MNSDNLKTFYDAAEKHVASVRSNLLLVAQTGSEAGELAVAARSLRQLKSEVASVGLDAVAAPISECERAIETIFRSGDDLSGSSFRALDLVSRIEATLLEAPLADGGLITDVEEFINSGFENIVPTSKPEPAKWLAEEFEVDEETLEIFREEADGLLERIRDDLARLKASPDDQAALWDIRRNAHTFKGAAGIVGLTEASETAHDMEDLLDKLVELRRDAAPNVLELLSDASELLDAIVSGKKAGGSSDRLRASFAAAVTAISEGRTDIAYVQDDAPARVTDRPATVPIVRVSLDRVDALVELARSIADNRRDLETLLAANGSVDPAVARLLGRGRDLVSSLTDRLRRVRKQRFGMLETRLRRAVNVTCEDEEKLVNLTVENGDVEIDTTMVDALIEPLLHLLKNAVVHGIELPETRRLIGKPETGEVVVSVRSADGSIMISISDDGRGISAEALRRKAVQQGAVTADEAALLDDEETLELIFRQGLTTAETLNLNAGRGIGMAIVKESIEALGGHVRVSSEWQSGTRFILDLPVEPNDREVDKTFDHLFAENEQPTILVVDDSASIRRHTVKLLEAAGCRALTAIDGAEALEIMLSGNWRPDLVISDVEMPRMDGWELLRTIKESFELGSVPVVLVTSLDAEEHRARAFELGADNYVIKPLKAEHLATELAHFIFAAAGSA